MIRTGLPRNRTLHNIPVPLADINNCLKEKVTAVEAIWKAIQEVRSRFCVRLDFGSLLGVSYFAFVRFLSLSLSLSGSPSCASLSEPYLFTLLVPLIVS